MLSVRGREERLPFICRGWLRERQGDKERLVNRRLASLLPLNGILTMPTLNVFVHDTTGRPVAGARVVAVTRNAVIQPSTRLTQGDGGCNLYFQGPAFNPPVMVDLIVDAEGFKPWCTAANPIAFGTEDINYQIDLLFKSAPANLHDWCGAFCIPDGLIGSPYGDGRRIWTPSYGVYNDDWRGRILDAYVLRGYTHFVYNIASPDGVYHNDYPALADDPARARRDLSEIRARGLVAVVAACNDANGGTTTPYASVMYNADLIPIIFPMWEMNGPLGVDTMIGGESVGRIGDCIRNTRAAAPHSLCYVHFTAGHGAGAEPEGEWWQWFHRQGGAGLLSQDDHWDDPVSTAAGLTDTARHLKGHVPGWEGLDLDNVAFELQTTALYHYGRTEQQGLDYMQQVLNQANGIAGFCDSGRV